MIQLVHTTRIAANVELDTIYIFNGNEKPIQAEIGESSNPITRCELLKPQIMKLFRVTEENAVEWIGLLNDEIEKILRDPESEDEDDEQGRKSIHYIHKYYLLESL